MLQKIDILATSLSVLHNYFDQQNYFSDLYPAKILDFSAKPFFLTQFQMCILQRAAYRWVTSLEYSVHRIRYFHSIKRDRV